MNFDIFSGFMGSLPGMMYDQTSAGAGTSDLSNLVSFSNMHKIFLRFNTPKSLHLGIHQARSAYQRIRAKVPIP